MFSSVANDAGKVLKENRNTVNFRNYVTSEEHKLRLKKLPKRLRIPREKWFGHRNWPGRIHMPNYHVHFRQDMKESITALVRSFQSPHLAGRRQSAQSALRLFQGNLRSLSGHVGIEERAAFPLMVRANPDIDLKFLWEDHKELHESADAVVRKLKQHLRLLASSTDTKPDTNTNTNTSSDTGTDTLASLPVSHLRSMLDAASIPHTHCVERGDLSALVAKHQATAMAEMKAALRLAGVSTASCVHKGDVARLYVNRVHECQGLSGARVLEAVLGFDQELMSHLGEEEELVVPMELQDRPLH